MTGPGFLLLLALNLACNQQVVFNYSHSSESVGGSNEVDEGKFHIEDCVVANVIEIICVHSNSSEIVYDGVKVGVSDNSFNECVFGSLARICNSSDKRIFEVIRDNIDINPVFQVGS